MRVITYIDGFNLYFGLRRRKLRKYYWLDLSKLSNTFIVEDTEFLTEVKYFTSRINNPQEQAKRQNTYIEALESLPNIKLIFGKYQNNDFKCRNCDFLHSIPNEKKTDVNIAVELLTDAFNDNFDKAIIVSADSDLLPPMLKVKELFPNKKIIVAYPPGNGSKEISSNIPNFKISEQNIKHSQFPDKLTNKVGYEIEKPQEWL